MSRPQQIGAPHPQESEGKKAAFQFLMLNGLSGAVERQANFPTKYDSVNSLQIAVPECLKSFDPCGGPFKRLDHLDDLLLPVRTVHILEKYPPFSELEL